MASTSTAVTIGATTTSVLAVNSSRIYAEFVNDSDEVIYLNIIGGSAVMNEGIRIAASGGSFTIDNRNANQSEFWNTSAVAGICASGSKELCVTEIEK